MRVKGLGVRVGGSICFRGMNLSKRTTRAQKISRLGFGVGDSIRIRVWGLGLTV